MNKLNFHHEQALADRTLYKADGTAITTAHTYGVFNEEGRLKKLIGFFYPDIADSTNEISVGRKRLWNWQDG
jgi:hypothetical protein